MKSTFAIIEKELLFWENKSPALGKFFDNYIIMEMINLCAAVTVSRPDKQKIIADFIEGLALIPKSHLLEDKELQSRADTLTAPVIALIIAKGQEPEYQKMILESMVSGDSSIHVNGVSTRITAKGLQIYNRSLRMSVLTPNDVDELQQSFISFKKFKAQQVPVQLDDISTKLKSALGNYGFFDLPKIIALTDVNQHQLVASIAGNPVPYKIAMFNYLGFLKHLEKNYFHVKYQLHDKLAEIIDSSGRIVRGNINSLMDQSQEDKTRFKSWKYIDTVENDYKDKMRTPCP